MSDIKKTMRPLRLHSLPDAVRRELKDARHERGWSQAELGKRASLPQMHISGIESGKIVPRFDTLLDLVRVLDRDLVMIPRALVPAVQALAREYRHRDAPAQAEERPLYAVEDDEERGHQT